MSMLTRAFLAPFALVAIVSCDSTTPPTLATKVAFSVQPSNTTAGAVLAPLVKVALQDASGNTVAGANTSVTIALSPNATGATLSGTTTVAAINGIATFTDLVVTKAGTAYTLVATASSLESATSASFSIAAGAVSQLAFSEQPPTANAGVNFGNDVSVTLLDAHGNTVTGSSATVTLTLGNNPTSATLGGVASISATAGVASFTQLSITKAGTGYTLLAQVTGAANQSSAPFNITPASASKLAFTTQPVNAVVGGAVGAPVRVSALDPYDNVAPYSLPATIALGNNPAAAQLAGTRTAAFVNGVASFSDLSLDKTGAGYTLVVSAEFLAGATSTAFDVTGGTATALAFQTQPPAQIDAGAPFAPGIQVAVRNAAGGTTSDAIQVTLAIETAPTSGGALLGTLTATSVAGVATFSDARLSLPGSYTLRASATGLTSAISSSVSVKQEFAMITVAGNDSISPVGHHTCSLNSAGYAHCWGEGINAELGDDARFQRAVPTLVAGGIAFKDISAGSTHTCAVSLAGAAYCWGFNASAQLGIGTTGSLRQVPTAVSGSLHFVSISAGDRHTCGVTSSGPSVTKGPVYCWGNNVAGQLGDGTGTTRNVPTLVSGGLTFVSVSASDGMHTCGITDTNLAYCWGSNERGQIGDGSDPNVVSARSVPTLVANATTHQFTSISTGWQHTCAVASSGSTYCWGSNAQKQVGDGNTSTADRTSPSLVGSGMIGLSVGSYQNCAIVSATGNVSCWGDNSQGQLGDGTTTSRGTPAPVSGTLQFTRVQTGRIHSCGVTTDKKAYCWGDNRDSQVGDGTTSRRDVPTPVLP